VWGEPTKATADKGKRKLELMIEEGRKGFRENIYNDGKQGENGLQLVLKGLMLIKSSQRYKTDITKAGNHQRR
jgi:hypothetical protein